METERHLLREFSWGFEELDRQSAWRIDRQTRTGVAAASSGISTLGTWPSNWNSIVVCDD